MTILSSAEAEDERPVRKVPSAAHIRTPRKPWKRCMIILSPLCNCEIDDWGESPGNQSRKIGCMAASGKARKWGILPVARRGAAAGGRRAGGGGRRGAGRPGRGAAM